MRIVFLAALLCVGFAFTQDIPGLTAADVTLNLKQVDFACPGVSTVGDEAYWTCTSSSSTYDFLAEMYGDSATSIRFVQATGLNFSSASTDDVVGPFLGFVASLPYTGARPSEARQWVQQNINNHNASTVIAGVRFTIYAKSPRARLLTIEKSP